MKILLSPLLVLVALWQSTSLIFGYFTDTTVGVSYWKLPDWSAPELVITSKDKLVSEFFVTEENTFSSWQSTARIAAQSPLGLKNNTTAPTQSNQAYFSFLFRETIKNSIPPLFRITAIAENEANRTVLLERVLKDFEEHQAYHYSIPFDDDFFGESGAGWFEVSLVVPEFNDTQQETPLVGAEFKILDATTLVVVGNNQADTAIRVVAEDQSESEVLCQTTTPEALQVELPTKNTAVITPLKQGFQEMICSAKDVFGNTADPVKLTLFLQESTALIPKLQTAVLEPANQVTLEFESLALAEQWQEKTITLIDKSGSKLEATPVSFLPNHQSLLWKTTANTPTEVRLFSLAETSLLPEKVVVSTTNAAGLHSTQTFEMLP